jgi:hypothetical protein
MHTMVELEIILVVELVKLEELKELVMLDVDVVLLLGKNVDTPGLNVVIATILQLEYQS